jgi:hypothetical protein
MPLPCPNLDDRTYDQLVTEGLGLIPKNFPAWTDYNPSDPGVTLLELFAFLAEAAVYQVNRVPDRSLANFAGLVGAQPAPGKSSDDLLASALINLQQRDRAITASEFEQQAIDESASDGSVVARAKAIVEVISQTREPTIFPADEFIKLVIVPNTSSPQPIPSTVLRQHIFELLRSNCLIATRLKVVPPNYDVTISADITVVRSPSATLSPDLVESAVAVFLDPLKGGKSGTGWEFGRSVFRSELYQVVENVPGVDHVQRLLLNGSEDRAEVRMSSLSLIGFKRITVTVIDP